MMLYMVQCQVAHYTILWTKISLDNTYVLVMVFVMRVLLSQIIKCIKLATLALASKVVFVLLISFCNL